ncbi:phenazine biosynthesis FMN-dependent oxidase PhzG [Streptomyces sp. H27-D2]|uniref:phenazine biosynthesis FMN-dependent oxidase PhzG n=1 Tax=Streptomyces sp. H27-D2 TaxID=3046304 RepID=UPI002DBFDCBF|nr:phenazine biosynthesis FMN-dependent oxidase PhzG [Streptomyces sp. H27-D2]MEC4019647.1 phenazine biosynthesis FMN-dependent oxidase PhzG [Streptomyces sp. H27-D2]
MSAIKSESLTGSLDFVFPEYEHPAADPIALFRDWFANARDQGVREPAALALATADARGRASNRIVVVNSVTPEGLVFTSHADSRKGRELAATAWASGLLYWRETSQQVILSGPVERLSEERSEALWAARPLAAHPMSVASRQSSPLDGLAEVEALREEARRLTDAGGPLPRPAGFVGYQLIPSAVEFWYARPDRLHQRLRYDRTGDGWTASRLQP